MVVGEDATLAHWVITGVITSSCPGTVAGKVLSEGVNDPVIGILAHTPLHYADVHEVSLPLGCLTFSNVAWLTTHERTHVEHGNIDSVLTLFLDHPRSHSVRIIHGFKDATLVLSVSAIRIMSWREGRSRLRFFSTLRALQHIRAISCQPLLFVAQNRQLRKRLNQVGHHTIEIGFHRLTFSTNEVVNA